MLHFLTQEYMLLEAARTNNMPRLTLLLKDVFTVDIHTVDSRGRTPLHLAMMNGNINAAAYLIIKGAKLDRFDYASNTPISLAQKNGHFKTMTIAIKNAHKMLQQVMSLPPASSASSSSQQSQSFAIIPYTPPIIFSSFPQTHRSMPSSSHASGASCSYSSYLADDEPSIPTLRIYPNLSTTEKRQRGHERYRHLEPKRPRDSLYERTRRLGS